MSGRTYQTLQHYRGSLFSSPQYTGIEYDFEVPDNVVVSSPGGVSTTQHHWTKGMYGNGASTYDVYAGEGNMYQYGEFGNLYSVGQNASTQSGMFPPGTDQMYTGNQSTSHIENFTYDPKNLPRSKPMENLEFISAPDTTKTTSVAEALKTDLNVLTHKIVLPNPWIILLMFVFLYIALDFVTRAGESVLFAKFHGGKTPDWRWLVFYASIFTILAIAIGASFSDPLIGLKKFEGDGGF